MRDQGLPRPGLSLRAWAATVGVTAVLTAVVLYGQIPEVTQAPPRWEHTVLAVPPDSSESQLVGLTRRIDRMSDEGWQYVGLLALENTRTGQSGLVLFRRLKR